MHDDLNQQSQHAWSAKRLQRAYKSRLIPPEKKPFLIDLHRSSGPYLAIDQGHIICDAASQIASLGLGFNAGALFGAAEYLESWTNQSDSDDFQAVRRAYEQLLQRKLGSDSFTAHFCGSGTEAIETALAYFYDRRPNSEARRVLAFEGAFHGRMMVALASTWNPDKREPFAWTGYEAYFAPYPEMDDDRISNPPRPSAWDELWSGTSTAEFEQVLARFGKDRDPLLHAEIESLCAVREHLIRGDVFAILVEPMQCEGGDRYASARFHQGLAYLSMTFQIPLVYDEIQTGFGLGGEFFWHGMFRLRNRDQGRFFPHAIVCGKKAQTGLVLIWQPDSGPSSDSTDRCAIPREQVSTASLIRGYIQASVIDQFQYVIDDIEKTTRQKLDKLSRQFSPHIQRPRAKGLAFAFDFTSDDVMKQFVAIRFQHGLVYYPAGSKTARFRLNLGYRQDDIRLFWEQLEGALRATIAANSSAPRRGPIPVQVRDTEQYFAFHETFIESKLNHLRDDSTLDREMVSNLLREYLEREFPNGRFEIVMLTSANYSQFRERILHMQTKVYEPARQSSAAEFDAVFASVNPLALLILERDQIVGMSFAGPLSMFTHQRGVDTDPYRDDPTVSYMLDLTVDRQYRSRLGGAMKRAMTMLAQASGVTAIHGRNRDRLAAGMWSINLSLGSYPTQYSVDDYPDNEPYRDCIYYRCPTLWRQPSINLGAGIERPLGIAQLDATFVRANLPTLVNKMTLSNFVTEPFLRQLEQVSAIFPADLRHVYTASGVSECVDKIVKVLWRHRRPRTRLLTIEGHDFGHGSFLSRSLSGVGQPYFRVDHLPAPAGPDDQAFFRALEQMLHTDEMLGCFLEPITRRTMSRTSISTLEQIVQLCHINKVPIVFHDSASLFYRYSDQAFTASGIAQIQPDAAIAYLGGQMALACTSSQLFIDEPLLLISTWDGDAFSLAQFHRAMEAVQSDKQTFFRTVATYDQNMNDVISTVGNAAGRIVNAVGSITGALPESLAQMLRQAESQRWLSCPSYSEMLRFNQMKSSGNLGSELAGDDHKP